MIRPVKQQGIFSTVTGLPFLFNYKKQNILFSIFSVNTHALPLWIIVY